MTVHATPARDALGYSYRYDGVMCADGARRSAYPIRDITVELGQDLRNGIIDSYGTFTANAAVYVNVYCHEHDDYFMVFGRIVWNGDSDEADAIFVPFDKDVDVENPIHLLPEKFIWGAALYLHGPFPEGFQPSDWDGPIISSRWSAA